MRKLLIVALFLLTGCGTKPGCGMKHRGDEDIKRQGIRAYKAGMGGASNPYIGNRGWEAELWFKGYLEAAEEEMKNNSNMVDVEIKVIEPKGN